MTTPPAGPEPLTATVARRVGELRRSRGWSLSALAGRAGLGKATLSEIEAGRRNPTLETLYSVASALEVPLVALIFDPVAGPAAPGPRPMVAGAAVEATLVESFTDADVTTEIYRLQVRPGPKQVSPGHGPGVTELMVVTSGALRFGPEATPVEVATGHHALVACEVDHIYEALNGEDATAVLVIRSPKP